MWEASVTASARELAFSYRSFFLSPQEGETLNAASLVFVTLLYDWSSIT